MKQRILIVGTGFAGMWSALSATRLLDLHQRGDVEVAVLARRPNCASARASTSRTCTRWPRRWATCSAPWA